jgi:hypothetical protein
MSDLKRSAKIKTMQVDPTKTRIISPTHSIEIGQSSWDPQEMSIRSRYDGATGRFSPHGSSELPLYDLQPLMASAAQHDLLSPNECAAIIHALSDSIRRQCP